MNAESMVIRLRSVSIVSRLAIWLKRSSLASLDLVGGGLSENSLRVRVRSLYYFIRFSHGSGALGFLIRVNSDFLGFENLFGSEPPKLVPYLSQPSLLG